MNYKQIFAIRKKRREQILKLYPMKDESGIYAFTRNKDGKTVIYVGQSKTSVLDRCAAHLEGYKKKNPSHIDKSLKAHGLRSEDNPDGWNVEILWYCKPSDCDALEKETIAFYRKKGVELYNITVGGQDEGKVDFQERSQEQLKRYRHGKAQGKKEILEKVRTFFAKYLDFVIKGKPNKIKERKLREFKELLGE